MIRTFLTATILAEIALGVLLSGGCAVFGESVDKIATGVEKYCEQPYLYRSDFRNTVNTALQGTGHTVHVHCAGDPDHETTSDTSPLDAVIFQVIDNGGLRYGQKGDTDTVTQFSQGPGKISEETRPET